MQQVDSHVHDGYYDTTWTPNSALAKQFLLFVFCMVFAQVPFYQTQIAYMLSLLLTFWFIWSVFMVKMIAWATSVEEVAPE